jgi:hypothetical protein
MAVNAQELDLGQVWQLQTGLTGGFLDCLPQGLGSCKQRHHASNCPEFCDLTCQ